MTAARDLLGVVRWFSMMAENVTARTDKDHRDALTAMVDSGEADSISEALRQTSQADLARRGYVDGPNGDTALVKTAYELSRALAWVGIAWLVVTALYPVALRVGGVFALVSAFGMWGVAQALQRAEPNITNRIFGRGDEA